MKRTISCVAKGTFLIVICVSCLTRIDAFSHFPSKPRALTNNNFNQNLGKPNHNFPTADEANSVRFSFLFDDDDKESYEGTENAFYTNTKWLDNSDIDDDDYSSYDQSSSTQQAASSNDSVLDDFILSVISSSNSLLNDPSTDPESWRTVVGDFSI